MKTLRLLLILFVFTANNALAQWEMGMDLGAVIPTSTLSNNGFPIGIGGDLVIMSPTVLNSESNFMFQFGFAMGGSDNGRKSFKTNSQFEEGSLQFYNCMVNHHLSTRLTYRKHPRFGFFTEAIVGHGRFHSGINETTNTEKVTGSSHTKAYSTHLLRYGAGLGTSYYFTNHVRIELRADYMRGGPVKFIDMSSVAITEDGAIYTGSYVKSSDVINIQARLCWSILSNTQD